MTMLFGQSIIKVFVAFTLLLNIIKYIFLYISIKIKIKKFTGITLINAECYVLLVSGQYLYRIQRKGQHLFSFKYITSSFLDIYYC